MGRFLISIFLSIPLIGAFAMLALAAGFGWLGLTSLSHTLLREHE